MREVFIPYGGLAVSFANVPVGLTQYPAFNFLGGGLDEEQNRDEMSAVDSRTERGCDHTFEVRLQRDSGQAIAM